jgi:hypothetical protein
MSKAKEKTIQYWRQHVEAFRASGLTREAYCKRERLWVHLGAHEKLPICARIK